jgi:hypothetical protein
LRHESNVALAFGYGIRDLAGIVVDLQCKRQLQCDGEAADQVDCDALQFAFAVPDCEKGRGGRRSDDPPRNLPVGASCLRSCVVVMARLNMHSCGRLRSEPYSDDRSYLRGL